jgi:hypothetical protein
MRASITSLCCKRIFLAYQEPSNGILVVSKPRLRSLNISKFARCKRQAKEHLVSPLNIHVNSIQKATSCRSIAAEQPKRHPIEY